MGRGRVSLLALLTLATASCDVTPEYLREDIQERRLEDTGLSDVDPSGTSPGAGMSVLRDLNVQPVKPEQIGADTTSAGYLRYVHRCGTCHQAPAPSIRTASEWRYVFPRMEGHMEEVGLVPLGPLDQRLILEFLERHAAER